MLGDPGESVQAIAKDVQLLVKELLEVELITDGIEHLDKLSFNTGNDMVDIVNKFIREVEEADLVQYLVDHSDLFEILVTGFESSTKAAQYAMILTELFKGSPRVCWLFLNEHGDLMDAFFEYMKSKEFQKSSDALTCFRVLLTKHPTVSSQYLQKEYEPFFEKMGALVDSENYITKRQSLRMLGDLLVIREHIDIMKRYLFDELNLVNMMKMLKSKSRALQFEAFHIFKLFIANPHKSEPVMNIIRTNREKMILFLQNFQTRRDERDDRFKEDKDLLIEALEAMAEDDRESDVSALDEVPGANRQPPPALQAHHSAPAPGGRHPYGVPQTITENLDFVDQQDRPLPEPMEATFGRPTSAPHMRMGSFGVVKEIPAGGLPIHSTSSPTHKATSSSFSGWGHNRYDTPLAGSVSHPGLKDRRISEIIDIENHKRIMSVEFPDIPD